MTEAHALPSPRKYCGAKTRNGGTCKSKPMPNGRCRMHGGATPSGPALPQFKTGRYSKYVPERLLERYQQSVDDPELLNMRQDIALLDARLADLLQRVDTGEAQKLWEEARKAGDEAMRYMNNEDYGGVVLALAKLDRAIGEGLADYDAWNEVQALLDQRRKLVEAEQKRLVAMQQMISTEQAMTFATALIEAVRRNVTDRAALTAIQAEFVRLVTAGNGAEIKP